MVLITDVFCCSSTVIVLHVCVCMHVDVGWGVTWCGVCVDQLDM